MSVTTTGAAWNKFIVDKEFWPNKDYWTNWGSTEVNGVILESFDEMKRVNPFSVVVIEDDGFVVDDPYYSDCHDEVPPLCTLPEYFAKWKNQQDAAGFVDPVEVAVACEVEVTDAMVQFALTAFVNNVPDFGMNYKELQNTSGFAAMQKAMKSAIAAAMVVGKGD